MGNEYTMTSETERQPVYASTNTRRGGSMQSLKRLFSHKTRAEVVTTTCRPVTSKDEASCTRKQVIKMLILVVILFFVCWGPRLTMEVLQKKFRLVPFNNTMYRMRMIFNILTFMHGCINPFIYCFMSKNFRIRFLKFLEVCGCHHAAEPRTSDVLLLPIPSQRTSSTNAKTVGTLKQEERKKIGVISTTGLETKHTDVESAVNNGGEYVWADASSVAT